MAVLELRHVTKLFPTHLALEDVSLVLAPAEFFSLVGPSGCGKTTTLRLIAGFEQPTSGEILLNGTPIQHQPPHKRNVNTVFQNYALFPHLTVAQNVAFGLRQRRALNMEPRVKAMLATVRLTGKESRFPAQLSGGERQRVALARSLVLQPDVLLLDEPLAALDPKLRKDMRHELKELQRQAGVTFLFVTHDQQEALTLSDRLAVMNRGKIEQQGTPRDLYLRPATRFTASFLGEINWIGEVGIRPEATVLSSMPPGYPARVTKMVFLGHATQAHVRLEAGGEATVLCNEHYEEGREVYVSWRAEDELRLPA